MATYRHPKFASSKKGYRYKGKKKAPNGKREPLKCLSDAYKDDIDGA